MDGYRISDIGALLRGNPYPGRGLVIGKTPDGQRACTAYFIMGRSANSRNRVFALRGGALHTEAFDAAKVEDPSLILYTPLRTQGNHLVVTNGDQTDTICAALAAGQTFADALRTRTFEPDAPNFTPRISGLLTFADGDFTYDMSILKSMDTAGTACVRCFYAYAPLPGLGHFLHTYACDGNPLPSFQGEPERVAIPDDMDAFSHALWDALDAGNRIALYVRYTDSTSGAYTDCLINKNRTGDVK